MRWWLLLLPALMACEVGGGSTADDRGFFNQDAGTTSPQPDSGTTVDSGPVQNMTVQVQFVIDGDTVVLAASSGLKTPDGQDVAGTTVRMLGVAAPEIAHDGMPEECWGDEAHAAARTLMQGLTVQLGYDPANGYRDVYGRLLAYIGLPDGRIANEVLIREGHAKSFRAFAHRERDHYNMLEAEAEMENLGGWSACGW